MSCSKRHRLLEVKQNSDHLKSFFASHSQFHLNKEKKKSCWWEELACHSNAYSSGTDWISPLFIQIAFRPLLLESHKSLSIILPSLRKPFILWAQKIKVIFFQRLSFHQSLGNDIPIGFEHLIRFKFLVIFTADILLPLLLCRFLPWFGIFALFGDTWWQVPQPTHSVLTRKALFVFWHTRCHYR